MTEENPAFPVRLFFSYSHKNQKYRKAMEKSLALLERRKLLKHWSDHSILPGQQISPKIREEMDKADIIVFLLSQDFIASDECMKEWNDAKKLVNQGKLLFRVPIILSDCAWKDLLDSDDVKALPNDGRAVATFTNESEPWNEVYEGIKAIINQLRSNFSPKQEFLGEMEKTDFLSQHHIRLQDIFFFLPLTCYIPQAKVGQALIEEITNETELLEKKRVLIHGETMSGKTALGRYLFLSLAKKSHPVLHIDLKEVSGKPSKDIFLNAYRRQFNGDYFLWEKQDDKTLILDNLSSAPNLIEFVVFANDFFDRIIITLSSDIFYSYFRDEGRLTDYLEAGIEPLTYQQQEQLIRKRLELSDLDEPVTDGLIDQIENRLNSISANKILPMYPFYLLTVLQTYEGYMPRDVSITSHGHCYYVLIVSNLIKAGISSSDNDINACFNFAEHLAFEIYGHKKKYSADTFDFNEFVAKYIDKFLIPDSIVNRLKHDEYGIITQEGLFKKEYMHYFFLGRFFSKDREKYQEILEEMGEKSYVLSNYLTLLFTIHHTNDDKIIDDILARTMCSLGSLRPAILDRKETKRFGATLDNIPKNILSTDSVEAERARERERREIRDIRNQQAEPENEMEETDDEYLANDFYRILKNTEILEQVLRNKYGSLEKGKVEEIIKTIMDSGLRLVNLIFSSEEEIIYLAQYIHEKHPDYDEQKIRKFIQFVSFQWTMAQIEKIVGAINQPEIRDTVNQVVQQNSTPAYELIGYFSRLDSAKELTESVKGELGGLLKKHDDPFLQGVLSIRTQHYMNTHHSKTSIKQSICSLLGIRYIPK